MSRPFSVSGRWVLGILILSIALWAVMVFGTLAHLRTLAGGLDPFDVRPFGYTPGQARALLDALGEGGRDFYARVQLRIDLIYPATYAASRGLILWWLTASGRLRVAPVALPYRVLVICLPVLVAVFDYAENVQIFRMLAAGPSISTDVIETASRMTMYKSLGSAVTELCVIALAIVAGMRWRRRKP